MTRVPKLRKVSEKRRRLSHRHRLSTVLAPDATTTTSERVKNRLEQLDAFEVGTRRLPDRSSRCFLHRQGGQQTQSLSQQEYVIRISEMSKDMSQAWRNDQRVKTLKLVIQVERLSEQS